MLQYQYNEVLYSTSLVPITRANDCTCKQTAHSHTSSTSSLQRNHCSIVLRVYLPDASASSTRTCALVLVACWSVKRLVRVICLAGVNRKRVLFCIHVYIHTYVYYIIRYIHAHKGGERMNIVRYALLADVLFFNSCLTLRRVLYDVYTILGVTCAERDNSVRLTHTNAHEIVVIFWSAFHASHGKRRRKMHIIRVHITLPPDVVFAAFLCVCLRWYSVLFSSNSNQSSVVLCTIRVSDHAEWILEYSRLKFDVVE